MDWIEWWSQCSARDVAELSLWIKRACTYFRLCILRIIPSDQASLRDNGCWSPNSHSARRLLLIRFWVCVQVELQGPWEETICSAQPREHIMGLQQNINLENERDGCQQKLKHKAKASLILHCSATKASFHLASKYLSSKPPHPVGSPLFSFSIHFSSFLPTHYP
jgi:hypothetical protein